MRALLAVALVLLTAGAAQAQAVIEERTRTYAIRGDTVAELAQAMSRRGPYSRAHGNRAWATASRDLKFTLVRKRTAQGCRAVDARVTMSILYRLPNLEGPIRASEARKWKRMRGLLEAHERVHGKLYARLARQVHKELKLMPPARTCRALDRDAQELVERLGERNKVENASFDAREGQNYRRMVRLFSSS